MNKDIEIYHRATNEQELVESERKMKTRKSNFVLNKTVSFIKKVKSCRQEILVVKLEKGKYLRIHCSTTAFETANRRSDTKIALV